MVNTARRALATVLLLLTITAAGVAMATPSFAEDVTCAAGEIPTSSGCQPAVLDGKIEPLTNDGMDYLPAYRWADYVSVWSDVSGWLTGPVAQAGDALVSLEFGLASLMWKATLLFVRLAMTSWFAEALAPTINQMAASFTTIIGALILPIILFMGIKAARSGGPGRPGIVRVAVTFIIFASAMVAVGQVSSAAVAEGTPMKRGTLPWMAATVSNATADAVSKISIPVANLTKSASVGASGDPSCEAYVEQLYTRFRDASPDMDSSRRDLLVTMSNLWERSFLQSWQQAQFGTTGFNYDPGSRVYCHLLEIKAGIPATEQANLAAAAYPELAAQPGAFALNPESGGLFGPFYEDQNHERARQAALVWAACDWTGSELVPAGGFRLVQVDEFNLKGNEGTRNICLEAFQGQVNADDQVSQAFNYYAGRATDALSAIPVELRSTPEAEQELANLATMLGALNGENFMGRLLSGTIAMITAGAYLFVLGGVSLGMIIIQVGLVLLLMLVPVSLLLSGFGSKAGPRMLKLTGAAAISNALFATVIVVLVGLVAIITSIITITAGGS